MSNQVVLVELNYEVTPIRIRECLSSKKEEVVNCFKPIGKIFVMATCHRFTFLTLNIVEESLIQSLKDLVPELKRKHLLLLNGEQAVSHWYATICGLNSRTIGEHEVLGQVRNAFTKSEQLGPELNELVKRAIHVGKRARTETGIGRYATSLTSITRDRIQARYPKTNELRVMIFGTGELSRLILQMLRGLRVNQILVVSKELTRAEGVCTESNMEAVPLTEASQYFDQVEVVIGATWTDQYLLMEQDLSNTAIQLLIDLGMPRNFDPIINKSATVQLFDLNTLNETVAAAKRKRNEEVVHVEKIIHQEVKDYFNWLNFRMLIPEVQSLRAEIDALFDRCCLKVYEELFYLDAQEKRQLVYRLRGLAQQHFSRIIDVLKSDLPALQKATSKLEILHALYDEVEDVWQGYLTYDENDLNLFELMSR
ncbi:MAG: hypothetical protein R8G66_01895 [Cytophagales bacterium]|nr:hypothetical protein [Cytophagales bacterium]